MIKNWFSIARILVTVTLLTGMFLHIVNLLFGTDVVLARFYTPLFDSLFAVPMLLGGVAIIAARKEFDFRNLFEKIVVIWTAFYFLASFPLHAQVWITQNTEYIRWFPIWYSAVFLTYTTVMLIVWWRLRTNRVKSSDAPTPQTIA